MNFVIVDKDFSSYAGHSYEYNRSVITELKKRGIEVSIYGNTRVIDSIKKELNVVPFFGARELKKKRKWYKPGNLFSTIYDFRDVFRQLDESSVVFFPNIFYFKRVFLIIIGLWLAGPRYHKILFLYRFSIKNPFNSPVFFQATHLFFNRLIKKGKIVITTDTEIIAEECKKYLRCPAHVLPIPHIHELPVNQSLAKEGTVKVYLPGDARLDKGIDILLAAMKLISLDERGKKIECIIQVCSGHLTGTESLKEDIYKSAKELGNGCGITILGNLSSEEYYSMICDADIILLPYRVQTQGKIEGYYARTSGIFSEAVAAEKPIITTQPTWMSLHLAAMGSGICIDDHAPSQLADAIIAIADKIPHYKTKAAEAAITWKQLNNPVYFCNKLLAIIEK